MSNMRFVSDGAHRVLARYDFAVLERVGLATPCDSRARLIAVLISSRDYGFLSDEVSPTSRSSTSLYTTRRMYFPVSVSGISSTTTNSEGTAYSPTSLEQFRSSCRKSSCIKLPPGINVMKAQGVCPVSSSATPTMMQLPTGEFVRNLSRRILASIYPVPTR